MKKEKTSEAAEQPMVSGKDETTQSNQSPIAGKNLPNARPKTLGELVLHLEELKSKSENSEGRRIVKAREDAIPAIEYLSERAKAGDAIALKYLHEIASLAVEELGAQSIETLKEIAASSIQWPTMMSPSEKLNAKLLDDNLYSLGLGSELTFLTFPDAIAVKGSRLKELVARLTALVGEWRDDQGNLDSLVEMPDHLREQGLDDDAIAYALNLARENRLKSEQRIKEKIDGLQKFLGDMSAVDSLKLRECRQIAVGLPELTADHACQNLWFKALMKVLEAFTDSRYDRKHFQLKDWWGIKVYPNENPEDFQSERTANIRNAMKKAFHEMLFTKPR